MKIQAIRNKEYLPLLLPLVRAEAEELGIDPNVVSIDKCLAALENSIENGAVLIAVNEANEIVGTLSLFKQEKWWSTDLEIMALMFYVRQNARNSKAGMLLLKQAMAIVKEQGLQFTLFLDSRVDLERKDKVFKRLGFTCKGGTYTFNGE